MRAGTPDPRVVAEGELQRRGHAEPREHHDEHDEGPAAHGPRLADALGAQIFAKYTFGSGLPPGQNAFVTVSRLSPHAP